VEAPSEPEKASLETSANGSQKASESVVGDEAEDTRQEISPEDIQKLESLAGKDFTKQLVEMYQAAIDKMGPKKSMRTVSEPIGDKALRGQIHQVGGNSTSRSEKYLMFAYRRFGEYLILS
jgi:hypothetical protein